MSTAPLVRLESMRSSSAEEKGVKCKIRLQHPQQLARPVGAAEEKEEEAPVPPPAREDDNDTISLKMPYFLSVPPKTLSAGDNDYAGKN